MAAMAVLEPQKVDQAGAERHPGATTTGIGGNGEVPKAVNPELLKALPEANLPRLQTSVRQVLHHRVLSHLTSRFSISTMAMPRPMSSATIGSTCVPEIRAGAICIFLLVVGQSERVVVRGELLLRN
jgi:hypothetical protein